MPYSSKKQQAFFHTDTARKAGISPATVKQFDKESKGKKLPRFAKLKERFDKKDY